MEQEVIFTNFSVRVLSFQHKFHVMTSHLVRKQVLQKWKHWITLVKFPNGHGQIYRCPSFTSPLPSGLHTCSCASITTPFTAAVWLTQPLLLLCCCQSQVHQSALGRQLPKVAKNCMSRSMKDWDATHSGISQKFTYPGPLWVWPYSVWLSLLLQVKSHWNNLPEIVEEVAELP